MALVFFRDVAAPLGCALALARALRNRTYLHVRMGLHSGPVFRVEDINAQVNVTGDGINVAQRVMACGDAGHILLSGATSGPAGHAARLVWANAGPGRTRGPRTPPAPVQPDGPRDRKPGKTEQTGTVWVPHRILGQSAASARRLRPPGRHGSSGSPGPFAEAGQSAGVPVPPVGTLPLDSAIYIERATDAEFRTAIGRRDSIVLLKGARQMGKTSLLARGLQQAREFAARVIWTDFQMLNACDLDSVNQLLQRVGQGIAVQLGLEVSPEDVWKPHYGPNLNFKQYVLRQVLGQSPVHVVWGLDEVEPTPAAQHQQRGIRSLPFMAQRASA